VADNVEMEKTAAQVPVVNRWASFRAWMTARPFMEAVFWAGVMTACFFAVYSSCTWVTHWRDCRDPASVGTFYFGWERSFPFVPAMILPYMSIDLFFFFAPFVCEDGHEMRAHGKRVICALVVAAACFLAFPLKMGPQFVHPPVGGLFGLLFSLLGQFDRPYNLVPSLHMAFRSLLLVVFIRRVRGIARILLHGWFILIVVSLLLTWQHHLVDLIAGQVLAICCLRGFPDRAAGPDPKSSAIG
jgi:hypothetical protein